MARLVDYSDSSSSSFSSSSSDDDSAFSFSFASPTFASHTSAQQHADAPPVFVFGRSSAKANAAAATAPAFQTAFAQDAFEKMRVRLSVSSNHPTATTTATTSAFSSPFVTAAATASAARQPQSATMAATTTNSKKATATFAGKQPKRRVSPFPSFTSRPGAGSKADKAGAAPWSPLVTPGSAPSSQPQPLATDAVMNDASGPTAFQHQAPVSSHPHAPVAFTTPVSAPVARPVFQFGASASSGVSAFGFAASSSFAFSPAANSWPFQPQQPTAPATASVPAFTAPAPSVAGHQRASFTPRSPFSFGDTTVRSKRSMDDDSEHQGHQHHYQQQQPGHATSSRDSSHTTARRASLPARTHATFVFGAAQPRAATPPASSSPFPSPQVPTNASFSFNKPAAPVGPFVFGRANSLDEPSSRRSSPETAAEPRAGDFTFEPRRRAFVSPQRSTPKTESQRLKLRRSFHVKATLGPTGKWGSGGTTADGGTHSPFGLKKPATATRTTVFQQRRARDAEYAAPADPFVTPLFSRPPTTASDQQQAKVDFTFESRPATATPTAASTTPRATNVYQFGSTGASNATHSHNDDTTGGAHARTPTDGVAVAHESPIQKNASKPSATVPGRRRILRATRPSEATRSSGGGPSSSSQPSRPPADAASATDSGDTSMGVGQASDGSEWGELKQLGGAAYARRHFREAAELYRQSLDAITVYLSQYPDDAVLKDKAKLHANRAASLMMVLQYADAQYECQQSIAADPAYTRAYIRLSRIQLLFGDLATARANLAVAKEQLAQLFFLNVDPADRASVEKIEVAADTLAQLQAAIKRQIDGAAEGTKALKLIEDALAIAPNCRTLQAQKTLVLFTRRYKNEKTTGP